MTPPKIKKLKLGKFTTRKGFLFLGMMSWVLSMVGSSMLQATAIVGIAIVIVTIFHGLVIVSVIQRKPLNRRITEANVARRSNRED